MSRRLAMIVFPAIAALLFSVDPLAAEVTAEVDGHKVVVKVDGQLFTEYIENFDGTPILWPIIGPTGQPMTRSHPMAEGPPSERRDHPHHRSLWFTHGDVNGLSFWHEETIKHRKFVKIESGRRAVIVTENDWIDREGKVVCSDVRCFTFGANAEARWIDFAVTVIASNGPVKFGDTKEGTMGIRLAGTMKVDAKKENPAWGGHIVNSEGQVDTAAWGQRAAWVDYYGPVDGETVGVAILNHPSSFRFPTYWHVRTYGLFAANPFGLHHFEGNNEVDGSHTLQPGESMLLRSRFLFHRGDEKVGAVAEAFAAYAKEPALSLD